MPVCTHSTVCVCVCDWCVCVCLVCVCVCICVYVRMYVSSRGLPKLTHNLEIINIYNDGSTSSGDHGRGYY